jgi:Tfp pilus assembly protein PilZ
MSYVHVDLATRRRWPRLELVEMVKATVAGLSDVSVVNVSAGGLLVMGSRPYVVGDVHEFRYMTTEADPRALVFLARVAHCAPVTWLGGDTHAVGLEFVPPETDQQRNAIEVFIRLCVAHSGAS